MTEKKHVKRKEFKKFLRVDLTREELLIAGAEMSDEVGALEALDKQLTEVKAQYKGKMTACEAQISALSSKVRCKYEMRETQCERVLDYDKGTVTEIRQDSFSVIETRKMTAHEKQVELDLDSK